MKTPLIYMAIVALASGPALAQTATGDRDTTTRNQKQMERGSKDMGPVSSADFVKKAAMSGMFEVKSSELAVEKTENAEISAFARQMVNDHTRANERLMEIAGQTGNNAPDNLDDKHKEKMDKLRNASGAQFDRQYMDIQVKAHQKAVDLFRNYGRTGDNAALKSFAQETLPTLERHLEHAQRLQRGAKS